jgi:hypothetical protein
LQSLYHLGGFREGILAAAASEEEEEEEDLEEEVQSGSAIAELARTFAMLSGNSGSDGSGGRRGATPRGVGDSPGRTLGLCRSLGVDVRLQVCSRDQVYRQKKGTWGRALRLNHC